MLVHPTGSFDDRPAHHEHIDIRPLAAVMGEEVCVVDLARVTDGQFAETHAASSVTG